MATQKTKARAAAKLKPRAAATRPRNVEVKVDRALAQAWKKVLAVLEASNREGMQAWDRKYEAIGEIIQHDPPLYLAGGVSTDGDFFAKYLPGEDSRTILRNVRVAQYASPDEEVRYGTSKIDAALDYLEAKHGKPTKGRLPVNFEKLRLVAKDGSTGFADATVDQVRAAARVAKRASGASKLAKRNPVVLALTKKLPKVGKDVTVHYANGRVTLGGIPVEAFGAVLRALSSAKLPVQE